MYAWMYVVFVMYVYVCIVFTVCNVWYVWYGMVWRGTVRQGDVM